MSEGEVRRRIIELLVATPFARAAALHGVSEGVAERLGVRPEVLEQAAWLSRANFEPCPGSGPRIVDMAVFAPQQIARPFQALAARLRRTPVELARSTLHAAMGTMREPVPRARSWSPVRGGERARADLERDALVFPASRNKYFHMTVVVSVGLKDALELRAAGVGLSRAQYVLRWLADLVDGQLNDLHCGPVDVAQMYDAARGYVLPILPASPGSK